jgi:SOS-response transcriptional repressor LexA
MQVRTKYEKGDFTMVPQMNRLDELSVTAQALFVWICKYADDKGQCFPSRKTLAKKLRFKNSRSIDKYIKELQSNIFIAIIKRKDYDGRNLTNIYQILSISNKDIDWKID